MYSWDPELWYLLTCLYLFGYKVPQIDHRLLQMVSNKRFWCSSLDFWPKQNFLYQTYHCNSWQYKTQFNQKRKSNLRWVFTLIRQFFLVSIFQIWGKECKKSIKTKIYHYVPRWIDFAPKNSKISKIPNFSNKPQFFFLPQFSYKIVIIW